MGQNALGFVALVFIYLPIMALRYRKLDPGRYGLRIEGWGRGTLFGLALTIVTLPPFFVGFHLWETVVFDHHLDVKADNYRAWPESLRQQPFSDDSGFYLWRRQRSLIAEWKGDGVWEISIDSDAQLYYRGGVVPREVDQSGQLTRWWIETSTGDHELAFWARGGDELTFSVLRDGAPPRVFAPGATIDEETGIHIGRSVGWIPLAILVQLLLVALPEEFFYRGYLQGRLNRVYRRRYKLGPFHTSAPILITSALFALGHFVIGFDFHRLAVFFPALAFGWLRDRTGGIGASIVFHAACNLMVELTVVHYWPS